MSTCVFPYRSIEGLSIKTLFDALVTPAGGGGGGGGGGGFGGNSGCGGFGGNGEGVEVMVEEV